MTAQDNYKRHISTLRLAYRKYKKERNWWRVDHILNASFEISGRKVLFINVRYKGDK